MKNEHPRTGLGALRMEIYKGIPVSSGVVTGKVFVLDDERLRIPRRLVPADQTAREHQRLDDALQASIHELRELRDRSEQDLGSEAADIFAFHLGMLSDPMVTKPIHERIDRERVTAEYAVSAEFHSLADRFSKMEDSAFQTKVNDVWDVDRRVLRRLIGEHQSRLASLDHEAVIVARELTPSQTASLDRDKVVALVTDAGGKTSHTAIVAQALRIPAVVGLEQLAETAVDGQTVIVDGDRGVAILEPDEETLEEHRRYVERRRRFRLSLSELSQEPSVTTDGTQIHLLGNVEFPQEIETVLENGGEGVGLFRTEFLFLTNPSEPSEEEQHKVYRRCVELLQGKPLTIRTMDLGADKHSQMQSPVPERNPALGLRSIRYCLEHLPVFKRQLRAILRASALGPVKIMFPLVTSTHELRQAKMVLHDVMEDLEDEGVAFDADIDVGIMVETPSSAIIAAAFAREVDFFSIGTNDLVQYTLAVDRTNERVASLYSVAHPAVQRLIKDVVRAGRRRSVPVSVCGEVAGDVEFTMLLIGLGLRTLSMTPSLIPHVKRVVRSVDLEQCERLARKVGSFDSERQVAAQLRELTRTIIPEAFDGRSVEHER